MGRRERTRRPDPPPQLIAHTAAHSSSCNLFAPTVNACEVAHYAEARRKAANACHTLRQGWQSDWQRFALSVAKRQRQAVTLRVLAGRLSVVNGHHRIWALARAGALNVKAERIT